MFGGIKNSSPKIFGKVSMSELVVFWTKSEFNELTTTEKIFKSYFLSNAFEDVRNLNNRGSSENYFNCVLFFMQIFRAFNLKMKTIEIYLIIFNVRRVLPIAHHEKQLEEWDVLYTL